jgi:hypothetical protein
MVATGYHEVSEAAARYARHRSEARNLVSPLLSEITDQNVRLAEIDSEAIAQTTGWQSGWDWYRLLRQMRKRPRHLELAIWVDPTLCGLAVGRISDRCIVATIHFVEARPHNNPLEGSIAAIATRYLDTLALLLGCRESSIESPLPALINFYKDLGYVNETRKGRKVVRLKKAIRT